MKSIRNAIVIGASKESIHAIKVAKRKGMYVSAFDGSENAEGLKYSDESFVLDIRDYRKIINVLDKKQFDPVDMVILPVPIGRYLISVGEINDHYGLFGPSKRTAEICTDKWIFHKTLTEKGLRDVECHLVSTVDVFSEMDHFPMILKPRYGSGSRGVILISNEREWKKARDEYTFDEDYVVEEAVDGTEYGIDGLVFEGQFINILIRKKIITPPPYRQCVGYISVKKTGNEAFYGVVQSYMESIISVIGMKNAVLHSDIIMNDDSPFVIELSARPSGHRLHDVFTPLVTGVDMIESFIEFANDGNIMCVPRQDDDYYLIRYFDMENEIQRIPDEQYLIKKYKLIEYVCNLEIGETKKIKDGHSLMERGYFILKGKDEGRLCEKADELLMEFI